nr:MAG TPA: hypothetical protein [Caudoviricetes sp.]
MILLKHSHQFFYPKKEVMRSMCCDSTKCSIIVVASSNTCGRSLFGGVD